VAQRAERLTNIKKIYPKASHGLRQERGESIFSKNHFASATPIPQGIQDYIDRFAMHRVAGNVFECPSTKDFWKVQGNNIVRLVGKEVNEGDSIPAAPEDKPAAFLANILGDLEF
jgi:hypothetical protein